MRRQSIVAAAVLALLSLGSAPVATATEAVHPEIQAVLTEVPGGIILDYHHAIWPALDMEMAVPVGRAVKACATGRVCAFTEPQANGTQTSWGTCGSHTIPGSFAAQSIANARGTGSTLLARAGSTVVASAAGGTWKNVSSTPNNLLCLE